MQDYTITKSNIECYKIRHKTGLFWADIVIDAKDKTGRIQIASDFGDWQYYWGACGCPFKEFLIGLDMHYAAKKFSQSHWFDFDATIKNFKNQINQSKKDQYITKELADSLLKDVKEIEACCSDNESEFASLFIESKELYNYFEGHPPVIHTVSPGFKQFWEKVWPVFINELKSEIKVAV